MDKQRRRLGVSVAGASLVLAATLAGGALAQPATTLPVTRLAVFTNGVGYFEHSGTVTGDEQVVLDVGAADMDDLLQSLVLLDLDGGSVQAVRYPSENPLPHTLASYSIDLSGNPTLANILAQARGESVTVQAGGETVSGVILGVERVEQFEAAPKEFLNLATDAGFRRLDLEEVRDVTFDDPALREEVDAALAAIARYRSQDDKQVLLQFNGEGERRVLIAYVRAMPVWKTSYRLVFTDDGQAELQGWAILDNPTSMDLNDVSVSFVAGRPLSFITSLYAPVHVPRQRLDPEVAASAIPEVYEQAMRAVGAPPSPAPAMDMFAEMEASANVTSLGEGVSAAASGAQAGLNFEYRVAEPVTVPRFESAMIPIVQQTVPATRVSIYDPRVQTVNPLRGALLENTSGLHLAAGTITVLDGGMFAGNARLGEVLPDGDALITYASDLGVTVRTETSGAPENITRIFIRDGILELTFHQEHHTTYVLTPETDEPRLVLIEHQRRTNFDFTVDGPAPLETGSGTYRLAVNLGEAEAGDIPVQASCAAGERCELTVTESRQVRSSIAITDLDPNRLALYLDNPQLSADDREMLRQVQEIQAEVQELSLRLQRNEERRNAIHGEQDRINDNMANLDRNSSLYQRYVTDLTAQEDELAELEETRAGLQEEIDALRQRLRDVLGQ